MSEFYVIATESGYVSSPHVIAPELVTDAPVGFAYTWRSIREAEAVAHALVHDAKCEYFEVRAWSVAHHGPALPPYLVAPPITDKEGGLHRCRDQCDREILTVGTLRELIKDLDPDTHVAITTGDWYSNVESVGIPPLSSQDCGDYSCVTLFPGTELDSRQF